MCSWNNWKTHTFKWLGRSYSKNKVDRISSDLTWTVLPGCQEEAAALHWLIHRLYKSLSGKSQPDRNYKRHLDLEWENRLATEKQSIEMILAYLAFHNVFFQTTRRKIAKIHLSYIFLLHFICLHLLILI